MSLYLVQHGEAFTKNEDPERRLTEKGISDTKRIAKVASGYEIKVTKVCHSGKKRAKQTAEIIASYLGVDEINIREGLLPNDDVIKFSENLKDKENIMIVGHLPFLGKLTSYLISGTTENHLIKFQKGGIVCLTRYSEIGSSIIKWSLMPKIN
jgi:phosphohistidine phosphatase